MSELLVQALLGTKGARRVDVDLEPAPAPGERERLEVRRRLAELEEAREDGRWRDVARLHRELDEDWKAARRAAPRARVGPDEVLLALGLSLEVEGLES